MTLVAGLVNSRDAVIGSDGSITHKVRGRCAERHLKSARLNDSLCVACSGDLFGMGLVISKLIGKPGWETRGNICEDWERLKESVDFGIEHAAHLSVETLDEIYSNPLLTKVQENGVGVMLAGEFNGKPYLLACSREHGSIKTKIVQGDDGELRLGVTCPIELEEDYKAFVTTGDSDGIVEAIRLVSRARPEDVSGNVCIRQLSAGFVRDWRLDS